MTHTEVILWQGVRGKRLGGFKFRRQHPIGIYITDFACVSHKLILEIDGATHGTDDQRAYDERRRRCLHALGWQEVRVINGAVYDNLEGVLELVLEVLKGRPNRCAHCDDALRK